MGGWWCWWINPLQTISQDLVLTLRFTFDPELDNNNANVDQVVENQSDSQNNEATAPAIEAFIDESNQVILNEDNDEILYSDSDPFEHLPYYHGEISREEAETKLKGMLKGSFLTR